MADEDVVIRRRLLTRTSTLGKTGLKRCAENLLALLDGFVDDSVDAEKCKQDTDALFWEMEQLEFEANKTDILGFTSQRELEAYETLNAEIDASIEKVSKEIEELKAKVHVEKTIRAYKEEYESISRVINELPSRKEIAAYVPLQWTSLCAAQHTDHERGVLLYFYSEITVEEKRLSDATDTIKGVDSKLDLRTKQFALLMSTIQNLKATLDEDVEMEEEEQQLKQEAEADDDEMEDGLAATDSKSPLSHTPNDANAGDEDGAVPSKSPSSP
ncbi:Tho complex subunit, partial [Globisporangium splendens]